ncbi:MROH5 protein, partial [Amazona guildingii]|nr:MROH5 protein [Amazona guildingii]
QQEDQKLKFLESICIMCSTVSMHSFLWSMLLFFQNEVAEILKVLLQEEPVDRLDTTVRQQVMLTIAAMSRAGLLLQEKNGLLEACFCSVFHLPPQDSQGPGAWLYCKTLSAMDSMLQVLVCSASTLGIQELQNIFKLLVPFITSETAVVQERAVARIAQLAEFFSTYPLPQFCSCCMQAPEFQHQCWKTAVTGKLVAHLTLCCTCKIKGIRHEAAEALFQLYSFTLQHISTSPCLQERTKQQLQESWQHRHTWQLLKTRHTRQMFWMFAEYLPPSERTDVIVMAMQTLTTPGAYSISMTAHMVNVLVSHTDFPPEQVLNIVWAIYRNLPSISTEIGLNSLKKALLVLTRKNPRETVASVLQCSPTCGSVAMAMWKAMLSEPGAARKVLSQLLSILMYQPLHNISVVTLDNPRILSLAAARMIHEILGQSLCPRGVNGFFPELFLALLFQVSFKTELTNKEVLIFWEESQQDPLTLIRSAVQSMRVLLRNTGFESEELAIEERGGWDNLLHVQHHLKGVRIVAREMMKTSRHLRSILFYRLLDHLSVGHPTWEMVAMVMFTEVLKYTDLSDTVDRAVAIFPMYLQSQCVGMRSLVLKTLYGLSERPDMARKILTLTPNIVACLEGTDSDAVTMAILVLSNLLPLLERNTLSLSALAIAPKLWLLFDNESDTVRKLSIGLFQYVMGLVTGAEKKKMKKEVWESLLPLVFHLHDQKEDVAKAAQETLYLAGLFLKWQELTELTQTAEPREISKRLLERRRRKTMDFLHQSEVYLQSPQEILRQDAVRFIGLIGQH